MKDYDYVNYVLRNDVQDNFEHSISQDVENENYVLLGFPGVGKSTSSKGIVAEYILRKKPAIYLKIDRASKSMKTTLEFIKINDKIIAIPVVILPPDSITPENVLSSLLDALKSLESNTEKLIKKIQSISGSLGDLDKPITDIKELLKNIIGDIPNDPKIVLEFAKMFSDVLPYVNFAVKICLRINEWNKSKRLEKLERNDLLIVIDDLEDLSPNWILLQKLLSFEFRFLFVIRVEKPNDYLSLLNDRTYATEYLEKNGISINVKKNVILPLPSYEIFESIIVANKIPKENMLKLWECSGGIPAVALMLWAISTHTTISESLLKIKNLLQDKSINLSWKTTDIEIRLAYTLYATKIIYEQLKLKNYGYVALAVQPHGVSQDELALFCGCMFGEICSDNNKKVNEVVKFFENCVCDEMKSIKVLEKPCINSPCRFSLDADFIETFESPWLFKQLSGERVIDVSLPSISSNGTNNTCYSFNSLFKHITPIIEQLEKNDNELHDELEKARKAMLRILTEELKITSATSSRQLFSAYHHMGHMDNYSHVEESVSVWMSAMISNHKALVYHYENLEEMLDLMIVTFSNNQLNLARLLPHLCTLLRYQSASFSNWLMPKIMQIINELEKSTNKLILYFLAQSLATLGEHFSDSKEIMKQLSQYDSESILKKISDMGDEPFSLYAKIVVYADSAEGCFARNQYSKAQRIFDESSIALEKLKKMIMEDGMTFPWFRDLLVKPELELLGRDARLNGIQGTLYFYLDQLDKSAEKYEKSAKEYRILDLVDAEMDVQESAIISRLMKKQADVEIRKLIEMISSYDKDILDPNKKGKLILMIPPEQLVGFHVKSVIARLILNKIYGIDVNLMLDKSLVFRPRHAVFLHCAIEVLNKFLSNTIKINPILESILHHFDLESDNEISFHTSLIHKMQKNNLLSIQTDGREITLIESKQKILEWLDYIYRNTKLEGFCREYRDNTENGLLIESTLVQSFYHHNTVANIIGITIPLLYDKSEIAQLTLYDTWENNMKQSPLLRRLCGKLRITIHNYYTSNGSEKKRFARELIMDYMKIWYYFC